MFIFRGVTWNDHSTLIHVFSTSNAQISLLEHGVGCYRHYRDLLAIEKWIFADLDLVWVIHMNRLVSGEQNKKKIIFWEKMIQKSKISLSLFEFSKKTIKRNIFCDWKLKIYNFSKFLWRLLSFGRSKWHQ